MLAERTTRISSSPTMKGLIAAERLRKAGVDVVDLSAGEPDFPTPEHVKDAAHAAIAANFTKYTANSGSARSSRRSSRAIAPTTASTTHENEVIVCAGGKQALLNAALAVFDPGDEVITHTPGWPTLVEQIKLADATPVDRAHLARGWLRAAGAAVHRCHHRRARRRSSSTRPPIRRVR